MAARRGASGLSGILPVDKPAGMTSHDVVSAVRRLAGERRVGHAGTLDPMATGLLVILIGPSTRLARYLSGQEKSYEARIEFGTETDSDDAEGAVTRKAPVPPELSHAPFVARVLEDLVGPREQVPPAFSAVSVGGRRSHRLARRGLAVELAARPVDILSAELLAVYDTPTVAWDVRLKVSKGTYIRALARDVGRELETAAHLAGLRRLTSGSLSVEDARGPGELEDASRSGNLTDLFVEPVAALGLPSLSVNEGDAARVADGSPLDLPTELPVDGRVAVVHEGRLLAVYVRRGDVMKAETVLGGGS